MWAGPTSSQSNNESLFFQAARGFDKKGRVFELGASASRLKQIKRSSSSIEGASADEIKKMKALVEELTQTRQQMTEEQETMKQQMLQEQEMRLQQMSREQEMMK
ncbi:hypothetical protein QN277_008401 [Acacia crassicarpa]|uniref:Uncharacterized protein n=1 Tax=Acacia crassicarpa TaxID=499986 RepID=A0AAE1M6M0_9FABA|nr:hypothetical protein QN277_008401 [Acacia crassicarpa]